MPEISTLIALAAFAISLVSLGFSVHFGLRDRCKLVTKSKFFPEDEYGSAVMQVKIVNAGRRIAVLRVLGGTHFEGGSSGDILGDNATGYSLSEQEALEKTYRWEDLHTMGPNGDVHTYECLHVEDTLGRRHVIKDSKKNIKKLLATGQTQAI